MKIAIIYGGKSGEHEVSLASASSIVRTIDREHTLYFIGITKNGEWFLQPQQQAERLRADAAAVLTIECDEKARIAVVPGGGTEKGLTVNGAPLPVDVVFPVLHGSFGEDGTIQDDRAPVCRRRSACKQRGNGQRENKDYLAA